MRNKVLKTIFFLLCIFELLLISYLRNFAGPINSPVYLLVTSISIAILYYQITSEKTSSPLKKIISNVIIHKLIRNCVFVSLSILIFFQLNGVIHTFPISKTDSSNSDIIPQTEYLTQRLLTGQQPYQEIEFNGYALFPTYLPLQWLPYIVCEWFHFDYRWLAAFVLWSVSFLFFLKYSKTSGGILGQWIIPSWPLILWFSLIQYDKMQFAFMLEGLIAGYYLFTCMSFAFGKKISESIGITFCLLSRYAIVLWIPIYFLLQLINKNRKKFLFAGIFICISFILIYWLPFMRNDESIFVRGYQYHTAAALGEWEHLNASGKPVHLFNGLGFAAWGYKFLPAEDTSAKLAVWQKIHLAASIFIVLLMGIIYVIKRKSIRTKPYLIMSFKIYLIVFYTFIQIPYAYLFIVPVIITSVLLAEIFSGADEDIAKKIQTAG